MRAWIIAAGIIDEPSFYRSLKIGQDDLVICADGGYDHARLLGITPSLVIGDMDSVSSPVSGSLTPTIQYPTQKNQTDTQLAVEYALGHDCKEIILLGATGGRLDHTLANVFLLSLIAQRGAQGMILTSKERIALITDSMTLKRGREDGISFIPITPKVESVTTQGLLYNMDHTDLYLGDTLAMSNEFRSATAEISIKSGKLLVICAV